MFILYMSYNMLSTAQSNIYHGLLKGAKNFQDDLAAVIRTSDEVY